MNTCPDCDTTYPDAALSCPQCHALTHRTRLAQLSEQARQFAEARDIASEAKVLEQMLALLPEGAAQAQSIRDRLAEIGREKPHRSRPLGKLAALGAVGLLIWKFKAFIVMALTKGKTLLLGLTKTKTLFTMVLSLSLYWSVWGWQPY